MVGTIVNVVFLVVEWWLKRQNDNAEALKSFYKFVHSVEGKHLSSVMLGESYRRILDQVAKEEAQKLPGVK